MSGTVDEFIKDINERYNGIFGKFEIDPDNDDEFATALHPIPENRFTEGNRITLSVESDVVSEYENRVEFVNERTKPGPMGNPWDLELKFGFDDEHGRVNNFDKGGMKGGYVFFAAHKGDILFCAELHAQKRFVEDSDLKELMDVVLEVLAQ